MYHCTFIFFSILFKCFFSSRIHRTPVATERRPDQMLRKFLRNFGRIRRNEKQAQKRYMATANDAFGNFKIFQFLLIYSFCRNRFTWSDPFYDICWLNNTIKRLLFKLQMSSWFWAFVTNFLLTMMRVFLRHFIFKSKK